MTKRTAYANVRNNTSRPLLAVGLVHKYSDDYKHRREWGVIQPGKIGGEPMKVEYNTGAFTTGRDWWLVTWYSPGMETMYYSDPNNFRDIIDWLESIAPDSISAAAGAVAGLGTSFTGPQAVAFAVLAENAAKATTDKLFNAETTAGFKQHILRAEDENAVATITINDDLTITITSNSGTSETVSSSKPAPLK